MNSVLARHKKSFKKGLPFLGLFALSSLFVMLGVSACERRTEIEESRLFHHGVPAPQVKELMNISIAYRHLVHQIKAMKGQPHLATFPVEGLSAIGIHEASVATDGLDADMTFWVNKQNALSKNFAPADLKRIPAKYAFGGKNISLRSTALRHLGNMIDAAEKDGHKLRALSAYRSFTQQVSTFKYWVDFYDDEDKAERESAWPGHSEHQLGTTVDLTTEELGNDPWTLFGESPAGQWLRDHAHEYGFTISYQETTEAITGYIHEPWHIRFVGRPVANTLGVTGLVLEQLMQYLTHYKPLLDTTVSSPDCAQFGTPKKQLWSCNELTQRVERCDASGLQLEYIACSAGCYQCPDGTHEFCRSSDVEPYALERGCKWTDPALNVTEDQQSSPLKNSSNDSPDNFLNNQNSQPQVNSNNRQKNPTSQNP